MELISVKTLNYSFDRQNKVLNNINYTLGESEKSIIIGANGSGKTTLLKCMLGLLKTGSEIKVANQYLEDLSGYTDLSANIKDALHLSGDLTVMEFLKYQMQLKGKDLKGAINLLDYFQLTNISGKKISKISTGQEKLIYNIVALAPESLITVLDEPLSGMDPGRVNLLLNLINSRKQSFIITLHNLNIIKVIKNSTLNVMVNGSVSEKIIPGDRIFSMYGTSVRSENAFMELSIGDKKIYLTASGDERDRPIETLEDLLYLN